MKSLLFALTLLFVAPLAYSNQVKLSWNYHTDNIEYSWTLDSETAWFNKGEGKFVNVYNRFANCSDKLANGVYTGPVTYGGKVQENEKVVLIPESHPLYNMILFDYILRSCNTMRSISGKALVGHMNNLLDTVLTP
jgi:hypothetical protein